jgi:hypothetical protein
MKREVGMLYFWIAYLELAGRNACTKSGETRGTINIKAMISGDEETTPDVVFTQTQWCRSRPTIQPE